MSIDLSLNRIRLAQNHLPPYTRPTIHIAGTNGKGSVVAILSSIFACSQPPITFGRFTTPHLVTIYDSISINSIPISKLTYDGILSEINIMDSKIHAGLSNFERLTLVALQAFERAQVDIVILEVGMGGRLDATNVIPDETVWVSALTSVDLDHTAFLGSTAKEIAKEKASITRGGRPLVCGPQLAHPEVIPVVENIAAQQSAPLAPFVPVDTRMIGPQALAYRLVVGDGNFRKPPLSSITAYINLHGGFPISGNFSLYGEHQLQNLGVALGIISAIFKYPPPFCISSSVADGLQKRITPIAISRGIEVVEWPGRLSFHVTPRPSALEKPDLIVLADGAHNSASASTLSAYISHILSTLHAQGDPIKLSLTYILSLSHSPPKTPFETLLPLFQPFQADSPNTLKNLNLCVSLNVAALPFTKPDGMPWVRTEPPNEITKAIRSIFTQETSLQYCLQIREFITEDTPPPAGAPNMALPQALEWAAEQAAGAEQHLVILAGSLYLVADFYRYLNGVGR